jgi:hypothetical protein
MTDGVLSAAIEKHVKKPNIAFQEEIANTNQ